MGVASPSGLPPYNPGTLILEGVGSKYPWAKISCRSRGLCLKRRTCKGRLCLLTLTLGARDKGVKSQHLDIGDKITVFGYWCLTPFRWEDRVGMIFGKYRPKIKNRSSSQLFSNSNNHTIASHQRKHFLYFSVVVYPLHLWAKTAFFVKNTAETCDPPNLT